MQIIKTKVKYILNFRPSLELLYFISFVNNVQTKTLLITVEWKTKHCATRCGTDEYKTLADEFWIIGVSQQLNTGFNLIMFVYPITKIRVSVMGDMVIMNAPIGAEDKYLNCSVDLWLLLFVVIYLRFPICWIPYNMELSCFFQIDFNKCKQVQI